MSDIKYIKKRAVDYSNGTEFHFNDDLTGKET